MDDVRAVSGGVDDALDVHADVPRSAAVVHLHADDLGLLRDAGDKAVVADDHRGHGGPVGMEVHDQMRVPGAKSREHVLVTGLLEMAQKRDRAPFGGEVHAAFEIGVVIVDAGVQDEHAHLRCALHPPRQVRPDRAQVPLPGVVLGRPRRARSRSIGGSLCGSTWACSFDGIHIHGLVGRVGTDRHVSLDGVDASR